MNKLTVFCILFTLFRCAECVPISCVAHATYTVFFEDADNKGQPGHSENKFFFDSDTSKTLNVQLRKVADGLADDTEMLRLNDSGAFPQILVANRSFHIEFTADPLQNIPAFGNGWRFTLTREQLATRTAWLPKESFGIKVQIKRSEIDKVTGCVVLIDTLAEPVLQWDLGTETPTISQVADQVGSKVFMRTSTCTNDVAVIAFQTTEPTAVIYLGVTTAGFATGTLTWYSLPADTICGADCTELQLLDMTLTNNRVFLATDVALYHSSELTQTNPSATRQKLSWVKTVSMGGANKYTSGVISYTAVCQWRHHDLIREDFITFSYKSDAAGGDVSTTLYSWEPFTTWINPLLPNDNWLLNNIGPNNVEVLGALYHEHTHNLALLVTMDVNAPLAPTGADDAPQYEANNFLVTTTHLVSVPLDETTNQPKTRLNFPVYTFSRHRFPDEEFPTGISYIPGYYIMFAYGSRNIYGSENGGGSWSLYYKADTGDIVHQIASCKAQGVFTLLTYDGVTPDEDERYVIYTGKAGIPRVSPLQPRAFDINLLNYLYIDSFGQISIIKQEATDGTYTKVPLDIVAETNAIYEVNFPSTIRHGLAIGFMGGSELVALEHRDVRYTQVETDPVSSYFQRPRHLNRVILSFFGGQAIVKSISYDNLPHKDYLSRIKLHVLQPFPLSSTFARLQHDITIEPGIVLYDGNADNIPDIDDSIHVTFTFNAPDRVANNWPPESIGQTLITKEGTYFIQARNVGGRPVGLGQVSPFIRAFGKRLARVGPGLRQTVTIRTGEWNVIPVSGVFVDPDDNAQINGYIIREGACRHKVSIDGINNGIYVLDITEGFQFTATAFSDGIPIVEKDSNIVASLTNAYLFRTTPKLQTFGYPRANSSPTKPRGFTAIRVRATRASLLCDNAVTLIEVYAGCPCNRYLKFHYPYSLTPQDVLTGNPKDNLNQALLYNLEANYRPPSEKGVMIPTCDNMYNVDPQKPKPRNRFKISQETGTPKQCAGANTKAECGCDDEDRVEDDPAFSDCKERVYRLIYPGKLRVEFVIKTLGRVDQIVGSDLAVRITEVNNRRPKYKTTDLGRLLPLLAKDQRFDATNYFNPADLEIVMNASGLFHYKAELIPGLSFCPMTDYFMVYVDEAPLPYPMNHIIFFSTTFVIGFILFAVFLFHLAFSDAAPKRATGPQCPPLSEMVKMQGRFKAPEYPNALPTFFGRISRALSRNEDRGDESKQQAESVHSNDDVKEQVEPTSSNENVK